MYSFFNLLSELFPMSFLTFNVLGFLGFFYCFQCYNKDYIENLEMAPCLVLDLILNSSAECNENIKKY